MASMFIKKEQDRDRSPAIRSLAVNNDLPGYLHSIDDEQRLKMHQLWVMFQLFIDAEHDDQTVNHAQLAKKLYHKVQTLSNSSQLTLELKEEEKRLVKKDQVKRTFFRQSATDDLDTVVLRFLRARKWDVSAAFVMLIECCEWRLEYNVHRLLQEGERRIRPDLLASGKGYIWSEDREGRICCYIRARLHDKSKEPLNESVDYMVYWLEAGRALRRYDEQTVTVIIDMTGVGFSSLDMPFVQFMFKCLQAYYPEILGKALLINAPWIFWGFWKLCQSFIDPVVAAKIKFIKMNELVDHIDKQNIPIDFGGTNDQFHFDFDQAFDQVRRSSLVHPDDSSLINSPAIVQIDKDKEDVLVNLDQQLMKMNIEILQALQSKEKVKITALQEKRDELKKSLRKQYYQLMLPVYPPSIYQRIGIIDTNGRINWSLYKSTASIDSATQSTLEHERASAPPSLLQADNLRTNSHDDSPLSTNF